MWPRVRSFIEPIATMKRPQHLNGRWRSIRIVMKHTGLQVTWRGRPEIVNWRRRGSSKLRACGVTIILPRFFALGMMSRYDPDRRAWAQLTFERLERLIALQPENPAPLARGAVVLVHLQKEAQAFSWIHRALTIDPESAVTCYNAAAVHSLSGDQETALHYPRPRRHATTQFGSGSGNHPIRW